MCINVRSLCGTPEANMIVNVNYTAIKEKEKNPSKVFLWGMSQKIRINNFLVLQKHKIHIYLFFLWGGFCLLTYFLLFVNLLFFLKFAYLFEIARLISETKFNWCFFFLPSFLLLSLFPFLASFSSLFSFISVSLSFYFFLF